MRIFTRDKSFYRQFFSLLLFIAGQNLIVYSVNLADNVMLGNYSETALSGVALANQVQFLLQMVVTGIGEGVVVLAAQYWGKRDPASIRVVNGIGMRVALITGLIFMAVGLAAPQFILGLLCNEPEVVAEGVKYMRVISFTYVLFCLSNVLMATMRSVENVRIGLTVSLAALVINIFLNYCFIFGRCGMPRMGTQGAALATLIARAAELGIVLGYAVRVDKKLKITLRTLFVSSKPLFQDYRRYAMPVILSGLSWGLAMFLQTAILGRLGAASIAANSIAASLFSVVSVLSYGASNAASVFTGKTVGEGDMDKLHACVRTMQGLFLIIGLITGGAILALRDVILSVYNVAPATRELAGRFITVLSVTVVGTSYQVPCLSGIVRGGGHTKFVFYNDLIFMWGIVLPISFLGAFVWHLDPVIVFFCLKSDQLAKCVVAAFEVNSYRWVRRLTRDSAAA